MLVFSQLAMLNRGMRFVLLTLFAINLFASKYESKDWFFRGQLGYTVHFVQDPTTLIKNNLTTGAEFDYFFSPRWSVGSRFNAILADNRIVLGVGAIAKRRFASEALPFIPYLGFGLFPSTLLSTEYAFVNHWNLGLRLAGGVEYFITPRVVLGFEFGLTPSLLWGKGTLNKIEASGDILFSLGWRL